VLQGAPYPDGMSKWALATETAKIWV